MAHYLLVRIFSTTEDKTTSVYLSTVSQKRKDEIGDIGLGPSIEKKKLYLVDECGIPHKWKEWIYVEYIPLKVRKSMSMIIVFKDKASSVQECIKRAKKFIKIYDNLVYTNDTD